MPCSCEIISAKNRKEAVWWNSGENLQEGTQPCGKAGQTPPSVEILVLILFEKSKAISVLE